jgi:GTPase
LRKNSLSRAQLLALKFVSARVINEVVFEWEPTIEAGAEQLAGFLHRRGEDSRLEAAWKAPEREEDVLSEEEIARQWEYNVANPHSPEIVEDPELIEGDDK